MYFLQMYEMRKANKLIKDKFKIKWFDDTLNH